MVISEVVTLRNIKQKINKTHTNEHQIARMSQRQVKDKRSFSDAGSFLQFDAQIMDSNCEFFISKIVLENPMKASTSRDAAKRKKSCS
jgi:hypothetical protein